MKVYVDNNQTVFICPSCHKEQYINVKNFDKKILNIKCECTVITTINLEYRKYFRKTISILGKLYTKNFKANILIVDLSIQGLKFKFITQSKFYNILELHEIINISFTLNGKSITKRCKIKNKYEEFIGIQFMDENFSRNIGFFLM